MFKLLKFIAQKIGMDKAIAYSSGARIIQALAGALSVLFIAAFLSKEEQGFYYTFGSLLAVQIFFELGLTGIITQFVAHEAAHLIIKDNGMIVGENKYRSRLASLVHFSVKWYAVIAILFLIIVVVIGFVFFNEYDKSNNTISWRLPWILICIGSAIKLFQSPFTSILIGLGKVKEMNKISFYQQLILPIITWIGLICGFKLYVIGISSILAALIWNIYVATTNQQRILLFLWKEKITLRINYLIEIFPYQWRIALSWISGYFIFQLFNPVLFATEGAVVAGQMGMTISVLNGIQALSMSWINTKVPLFSKLIALKDFLKLDEVFKRTLRQMITVCLFLLVVMIGGIGIIRYFDISLNGESFGNRFLNYIPMSLMMIALFVNQFVNSWATYLRCHKKEPYLLISIVSAILCSLSTIFLGKYYGINGITSGYCLIMIALMPWSYYIYMSCKNKWHIDIA